MTDAGYSKTPLAQKLGIQSGFRVAVIQAPRPYDKVVPSLPGQVELLTARARNLDMVHLFVKRRNTLEQRLPKAMDSIKRSGFIWVSWPKGSSGVSSDVSEDTVRSVALPLGMVDVKVCAVDQTWSGLKLVIRRENR